METIISEFNTKHENSKQPSTLSDFLTSLSKTFSQIDFLFKNFNRESLVLDILFFNFLKNFFVKLNLTFIKILIRSKNENPEIDTDDEKKEIEKDLGNQSDASFAQSEADLNLSSDDSVMDDRDQLDKLIDFEVDNGFSLQRKMIEACYEDISKLMINLSIFDDYQTEIRNSLKTAKKYLPKLIFAKNNDELESLVEDFGIEEDLQSEIQVIRDVIKYSNK